MADEMIKVDEQALAEELANITIPEETFKMDWKSAGIGFAGTLLIAGLCYGGYRLCKYYKAKKAEED